jgi:hypothetical protein
MARKPETKRIRILNDGLVDEQGQRWDRVRSGTYYLTPDDLADVSDQVSRFLTTGSYGTPVVEVTRSQFQAALTKALDHRVSAFRSVQGKSAVTLLLDTSDC